MLEDVYHFWYIAKSYNDAAYGTYPLGETHNQEMARRALFYYEEYLNYRFNYHQLGYVTGIDEMAYFTLCAMGDLNRTCNNFEKAIDCYIRAEEWCPPRNEHLVGLSECYRTLGDYQMMKMQTERLIDPSRVNPFPTYHFLVNSNYYIDTGDYGKSLHQIVCENLCN
jgi:tetratricopeptide (TPR) repeat protein